MSAIGFQRVANGRYSNDSIEISDLFPRNVLRDNEGDLYVVDADFKKH